MGTRIPVSISGNLVADPELTYGESGVAHAKLRVAVNQRLQNPDGSWRDGEPLFHNVSAFRALAENVANSLKKGDPVAIGGEMEFRHYDKDGVQHEAHRIVADTVGPDLRFGTVAFQRTPKANTDVFAGPAPTGPAQRDLNPGQDWGAAPQGRSSAPVGADYAANGIQL
ncbi:single-stranded DNA-binding protein [Arthrobacter sp. LAR12-1-1.1]|uniref:single-stranded DNA-binding protein n=1 Tax=Arthrobacter sp. LAR12-1-1.1 TaxID=3135215 RepID=UPI003435A1E5